MSPDVIRHVSKADCDFLRTPRAARRSGFHCLYWQPSVIAGHWFAKLMTFERLV